MPTVDVAIRPEVENDHADIRDVNRLAFGRDDEGRLVDALRSGGYARVSLVAEADGQVVGHVLFSALPIETPSGTIEALSLAPMAVVPSHQRRGIGSVLVREGLRVCRGRGHGIVIVLGHPEFYPRFGFSAKLAEGLKAPFSGPAFMALEFVPGALEGVEGRVRYPPPFEGL
jgi:putative acetyltransferase